MENTVTKLKIARAKENNAISESEFVEKMKHSWKYETDFATARRNIDTNMVEFYGFTGNHSVCFSDPHRVYVHFLGFLDNNIEWFLNKYEETKDN